MCRKKSTHNGQEVSDDLGFEERDREDGEKGKEVHYEKHGRIDGGAVCTSHCVLGLLKYKER